MNILIEVIYTVPCTVLHVACAAATQAAGGCTVDQTTRFGEWQSPDDPSEHPIEAVRRITVAIPITRVLSVTRAIASALALAGEHSLYVSHASGIAVCIPCIERNEHA